jgi:DNA-binding SARP family transcriptional activator
MQLQILGPLEIVDVNGVPIFVSGQKRRALLAVLVVRAGRTVSMDRLIEELWGGAPPVNATNALQAHIGRLRKAVEAACGEPDRIVTRPPGYCLTLRPDETDATEFATKVAAARSATPSTAIPLLRAALALWRGPALDGCVVGDICAAEAVVLDESKLTALEALYDASLRIGRHAEVIGELEESTAAHPLRERFYDQLMVALCRSDRQSDALSVYERARRRLITELGVEPGPMLRARERAIRSNGVVELDPRSVPSVSAVTSVTSVTSVSSETEELSREVAELQQRIETLASRQEALLRKLTDPLATG